MLRIVLPQSDRDAVIGDLAEEYGTVMVPKFGMRRARFWYWSQVVRSCWHLLKRWLWLIVIELFRRAA